MTGDEEDYTPETEAPMEDIAGEANEEVATLKAELAEIKDRALRAMAEVENTRRRAEREKKDASQYAIANFARDMLQVADNFSRAILACPAEERENAPQHLKAVVEGVEATDRQLMATLERHGIKPIDTKDVKFDPNLHQAMAEVPGNGKPAGTVVDVIQMGYVIGERLLRPAMVTVARKEPSGGAPDGGPAGSNIDTQA